MIARYIKTNGGLIDEVLEKKLVHANLFFKIDISRKDRRRDYTEARSMFCDYIFNSTRASKSSIGIVLGGRDHSTVINALGVHEDLMFSSPAYKKVYTQFCEFMDDMGVHDISSTVNRLVNDKIDSFVGSKMRCLHIQVEDNDYTAIQSHAKRLGLSASQYFLRCGVREYLRALEL